MKKLKSEKLKNAVKSITNNFSLFHFSALCIVKIRFYELNEPADGLSWHGG
jgi:hypothetical protein